MTTTRAIALTLGLAALVPLSLASIAQARTKQPHPTILCVPPGGAPKPCAVLAPNSSLLVALGSSTAATIYFAEVANSRKHRLVELPLRKAWQISPGVYRVALPRSLCAGRRGSTSYEIQTLVPGFRLRETVQQIVVSC